MRRWLGGVLAALAMILMWASPAQAHQPGQTLVTVSSVGTSAEPIMAITAQITLDRLDLAYSLDLSAKPAIAIPAQRSQLVGLIHDRVAITNDDGASWTIEIGEMSPSSVDGYPTLRVDLTAVPPARGAAERPILRWDVVTDVIYSHKVFVAVTDAAGGNTLLGTLAHHKPQIMLTLGAVDVQSNTGSLFAVGFEHFRAGADHIIFLGLVALGSARRNTTLANTLRRLALLTLTFTVGHSLSLALAGTGLARVPGTVVETGIAITILIAAVHAVRPIVPHRAELAITLLFGFVHGFGFATTLEALSLSGTRIIIPLLSFNLGLEAAQLVALALIAAQVWVIARSRAATIVLASAVGIIATSWIAERAFANTNPLADTISLLVATPERLAVVLFGIAVVTWAITKKASQTPASLH